MGRVSCWGPAEIHQARSQQAGDPCRLGQALAHTPVTTRLSDITAQHSCMCARESLPGGCVSAEASPTPTIVSQPPPDPEKAPWRGFPGSQGARCPQLCVKEGTGQAGDHGFPAWGNPSWGVGISLWSGWRRNMKAFKSDDQVLVSRPPRLAPRPQPHPAHQHPPAAARPRRCRSAQGPGWTEKVGRCLCPAGGINSLPLYCTAGAKPQTHMARDEIRTLTRPTEGPAPPTRTLGGRAVLGSALATF